MRRPSPRTRARWQSAAALAGSCLLHLTIYLLGRPDFSQVRDRAVNLEIVEGDFMQPAAPDAAGPREEAPTPPAGTSEPPPPGEATAPPPPTGTVVDEVDSDKGEKTDSDSSKKVDSDSGKGVDSAGGEPGGKAADSDSAKGGSDSDSAPSQPDSEPPTTPATSSDSDPVAVAQNDSDRDSDSSPGKGAPAAETENAICLHDVFSYAKADPDWMLWLSMDAFSGSRYDRGLAGVLRSFYLYQEMVQATEIDPLTELEGMLISSDDFSNFSTYQVVTTYNFGEAALKERLQRNNGKKPGFTLRTHPQGATGILPDGYRWDLVGSGRVMVASDAAAGRRNPDWPQKITCMMPRPPLEEGAAVPFNTLVRAQIGPAGDGRWPVLVLASRDAGAVGLHRYPRLAAAFRWAVLKGYFSDPVRIDGEVRFDGTPADMAEAGKVVKSLLAQGGYLRYLGLGALPGKVKYTIEGNSLRFEVPMTEAEVQIGLLLLKSWSRVINDQFRPRSPSAPTTPSVPAPPTAAP